MTATPAARHTFRTHPKRAFTLVELLVVIGIIVVLLAILIPSLESGAEASKRTKCASNLSAIGKALTGYVNDDSTNRYPQTSKYYMLLGQRGTVAGAGYDTDAEDSDRRPLNKFLGYTGKGVEVKVAQCPSDKGGQAVLDPNNNRNFTDEGAANGTSNVLLATGNSYVEAFGVVLGGPGNLARTGIAFMIGPDPNGPSQSVPAVSKVLVGDAPLHGENKCGNYGSVVGDPRNRWHESDPTQRKFNILFADSHVEFFSFGNPAKKGPDNIENTDGNGLPIGSLSTSPKPQRGFW